MTQDKGIPYQRHKPSAALREFLDPLDPGAYFDCGRARLPGLDDALLREAKSRGRTIGDDSFQLVATDMGLVFCRPSISFAIAARWEEVMLIRPQGDDPVVLPITWPTHGELKFTVSKRLAGNIFRRWLQLRMQVNRLAREDTAERFPPPEGAGNGSEPGQDEVGAGDQGPPPAASAEAVEGPASVDPAQADRTPVEETKADGPQAGGSQTGGTQTDGTPVEETKAEDATLVDDWQLVEKVGRARGKGAVRPTDSKKRRRKTDADSDADAPDRSEAAAGNGAGRGAMAAAPARPDRETVGSPGRAEVVLPAEPTATAKAETKSEAKSESKAASEPRSGKDAAPSVASTPSGPAGPKKGAKPKNPAGPKSSAGRADDAVNGGLAGDADVVDGGLAGDGDVVDGSVEDADPADQGTADAGPADHGSARATPAGDAPADADVADAVGGKPGHRTDANDAAPDQTGDDGTTKADEVGAAGSRPRTAGSDSSDAVEESSATKPSFDWPTPAEQAAATIVLPGGDLVTDLDSPAKPNPKAATASAAAGSGAGESGEPARSIIDLREVRIDLRDGEDDPPPPDGDSQRFPSHPIIRSDDPEVVTEPSWIGSPMSLVGTLVAVSTFVLITATAVGAYRRSAEVPSIRDPASPGREVGVTGVGLDPTVGRTTIDHQRFRADAPSVPLRSEVIPSDSDSDPAIEPTLGGSTPPTSTDPLREPEVVTRPRLCNSNYSGCVADVSDVDCPGDGDGPVFSTEPAVVMGTDVYGLDTDGDGETCEADQPPAAAIDPASSGVLEPVG